MVGINSQKSMAVELLNEANEYVLIVKRNRKKIGEQHTGQYVTCVEGEEPIERLLDILATSVEQYNPNAKKNKQKIKKWLKDDIFHDELHQLLFADK